MTRDSSVLDSLLDLPMPIIGKFRRIKDSNAPIETQYKLVRLAAQEHLNYSNATIAAGEDGTITLSDDSFIKTMMGAYRKFIS
jgi:hypothetical protein